MTRNRVLLMTSSMLAKAPFRLVAICCTNAMGKCIVKNFKLFATQLSIAGRIRIVAKYERTIGKNVP